MIFILNATSYRSQCVFINLSQPWYLEAIIPKFLCRGCSKPCSYAPGKDHSASVLPIGSILLKQWYSYCFQYCSGLVTIGFVQYGGRPKVGLATMSPNLGSAPGLSTDAVPYQALANKFWMLTASKCLAIANYSLLLLQCSKFNLCLHRHGPII